jgi:nicotinate-nucleotide adenylyltransferase
MQHPSKRIGIFGGTFDPPHIGHIAIAEQAKKQLGLDFVYFVPAYIPPHKQQYSSTTARHRMNMLQLAVSGRKEFIVSSIELRRRGISYTIDSLKAFKRRFPNAEMVLIIGADNLLQFHSWKSPKVILQLALLAVYKRIGYHVSLKDSPIDFTLLKGPMLGVSSTEIRHNIGKGLSIRTLVPHSIALYIKQHLLYSKLTPVSSKRQCHENHRSL